jgi:hypothetical protein
MDGVGNVGLAVRFKEIKSARQCVLTLHDRYLVHPREGLGMKLPKIRMVQYTSVTVKKTIGSSVGSLKPVGFARPLLGLSENERAIQAANGYATGGKDVSMPVAEAFQKILERVEKLDRENQRLLSLLVEDKLHDDADSIERERSPRAHRRDIPATGLPPWRMPSSR